MSQTKHPVLKMPFDLSQATDNEVYKILGAFRSGVEVKNFLCSAILYYARSPLVLSANALSDKLDKLDLDCQVNKILSRLDALESNMTGLTFQKEVSSDVIQPCNSSVISLSSSDKSILSSLKDKFRV